MKELIENFSYKDLIGELDEPTKGVVLDLDSSGIDLQKIGIEMSAMPVTGMSSKSKKNWDKSTFQKILSELAEIICKNDKENELSKKLSAESNLTLHVIIAEATIFVANKLGHEAALCTPFVILGLAAILKAGVNVFCGEYKK